MTREESTQRKIIEKGIRRYQYLLDNPDNIINTEDKQYSVTVGHKVLMVKKNGYGIEECGDFYELGNATVKPVKYTIDELKVGKVYEMSNVGAYYLVNSDGVLNLVNHKGRFIDKSYMSYNKVKNGKFVEVTHEDEEI